MDDFEREDYGFEDDERANKIKRLTKPRSMQHRTDVQEANLDLDDDEDTIYIDNLPQTIPELED